MCASLISVCASLIGVSASLIGGGRNVPTSTLVDALREGTSSVQGTIDSITQTIHIGLPASVAQDASSVARFLEAAVCSSCANCSASASTQFAAQLAASNLRHSLQPPPNVVTIILVVTVSVGVILLLIIGALVYYYKKRRGGGAKKVVKVKNTTMNEDDVGVKSTTSASHKDVSQAAKAARSNRVALTSR